MMAHVGDLSSQLLAVVSIWRLNQQMRVLSLCVYLSLPLHLSVSQANKF